MAEPIYSRKRRGFVAYALFFYNIITTAATLVALALCAIVYMLERKRIMLYAVGLFMLYVLDIVVLYMLDFIPEFTATFLDSRQGVPYLYHTISLSMLLFYRLLLGEFIRRPISRNEAVIWIFCFAGAITIWAMPDEAATLYRVERLFPGLLQCMLAYMGIHAVLRPGGSFNSGVRNLVIMLVLIFIVCEVMDRVVGFGVPELSSLSLRRIPMEVMGWVYTSVAIAYALGRIARRWRQYRLVEPALLADRYGLTRRESEVLRSLLDGLSNREIAERSYTSIGTVKTHVNHIYRKLGISGRDDLEHFVECERNKE